MNEAGLGAPLKRASAARKSAGLLASMPIVYVSVVLAAVFASYGYWTRTRTIFACPADGYTADWYIAYCDAGNYGEYEHGAFWFDLEPLAWRRARDADVLFLGNSRLEVGFSTAATADWFSQASASYYLLGFSYHENAFFSEGLLDKLHPRAAVFVINLGDFFDQVETEPFKYIWKDPQAEGRYRWKRFLQAIHKPLCQTFPALCGSHTVIYRSRATGAYRMRTPRYVAPVSYDARVDQSVVDADTAAAIDFFKRFAQGKCVILTMVPSVETKIGKATAIAKGLGATLVTPGSLEGLKTKDGHHLDQPSAERWSEAFFQAAGPEIRSCLEKHGARTRS
jgi:hypothetical protein